MSELARTTTDAALTEAVNLCSWFQLMSRRMHTCYRIFDVAILCLAASVTIVSLLDANSALVPGVLGAFTVLLTGLRSLFRFREAWARYASAMMAMRAEIRLYRIGAKPYDSENRQSQLIINANRISDTEHQGWRVLLRTPDHDEA